MFMLKLLNVKTIASKSLRVPYSLNWGGYQKIINSTKIKASKEHQNFVHNVFVIFAKYKTKLSENSKGFRFMSTLSSIVSFYNGLYLLV